MNKMLLNKMLADKSWLRQIVTYGVPAILVLAFFILFFIFLQATKDEVVANPPEEQIWTVRAATVQIADARPQEQAFGTVTASRDAQLRFGVAGEVAEVTAALRNGVDVKTGTILAKLDLERFSLALEETEVQIEAEINQISELETQLELHNRIFERARTLFAKSVGSGADVDAAELALSVATNQLRQAKSRLAQLQVAERRLRKDIEDATLTAPFDGTLSGVNLAIGNQVSSAHLVATLTDLSSLEVSFVVSARIYKDIDRLIGDTVLLRWSSGGQIVSEREAVIKRAEIIVDKAEGGGRLYAELGDANISDANISGAESPNNDASRTLPPGAFVEVLYDGRVFENVIELPEEALVGHNMVFAIDGDSRAEGHFVTLIHRRDGQVWVSSETLKNGDQVIATRLPGIGEGLQVRIANVNNQ